MTKNQKGKPNCQLLLWLLLFGLFSWGLNVYLIYCTPNIIFLFNPANTTRNITQTVVPQNILEKPQKYIDPNQNNSISDRNPMITAYPNAILPLNNITNNDNIKNSDFDNKFIYNNSTSTDLYDKTYEETRIENDKIVEDIINCLKLSPSRAQLPDNFVLAPESVRRKHFKEMLEFTKQWRKNPIQTHKYAGYSGPWVEHDFYTYFMKKNFSEYGPFIPIFVPWLDIHAKRHNLYIRMVNKIFQKMRSDCLYITVSQLGRGIEAEEIPIEDIPPNLLVLNGAGCGNMPIVYTIKPQELIQNFTNEYLIAFPGHVSRRREELIYKIRKALKSQFVLYYHRNDPNWTQIIKQSKFTLCPRGSNPASFRVFEAIQLGSIPIILWKGRIWLPYYGKLNYSEFSIIGHFNDIDSILQKVQSMTQYEVDQIRYYVKKYRDDFFTVAGNMKQIGLLMKNGFAGSNLVCDKHLKL